MSGIKLRVTRPAMVAGRRVEAGAIVTLPAEQAADALDSDKFALLDPADLPAVRAARLADVQRTLKREGRPWLGSEAASPWQRLN